MSKKVTMEDVAAASGVSKATVSYVLNDRQSPMGISAKTRQRVLEAVKQLRYQVDPAMLELSRRKREFTDLLVLSPWLHAQSSDFMTQLSGTLTAQSAERKLKISYELFYSSRLRRTLTAGKAERHDAVMLVGTKAEDESYLKKNRAAFPNVVLVNRNLEGFPCVYVDDYESSRNLAFLAAKNGYYSRYTVLVPTTSSHLESLRLKGIHDGLRQAGVTPVDVHLSGGYMDCVLKESTIQNLLQERTACFSVQYFPAALLMVQAERHGIAIPEQFGVAAFDRHSVLSRLLLHDMTTIDPRVDDMTRIALDLIHCIRQKRPPVSRQIQSQLIRGTSMILNGQQRSTE